jgi:hypothetical protein
VEGNPANTSASGTAGSGPDSFVLFPNYPNPFNASTTVSYFLPEDDFVEVLMFGANGTLVQEVVSGRQKKGFQQIHWDAGSRSSGLYFCRVKTSKKTAVQKCLYVK